MIGSVNPASFFAEALLPSPLTGTFIYRNRPVTVANSLFAHDEYHAYGEAEADVRAMFGRWPAMELGWSVVAFDGDRDPSYIRISFFRPAF